MTRRLVIRIVIVAVTLIASALLTEFALEARDAARYMPGQTFATVGDARIRYKFLGAGRPGTTTVFLSGISGSIEQFDQLQSAVSSEVPTLTYDRAGYGFSQGSTAHNALEQAIELAALLRALKIEQPVVLVAYSSSAQLARVFAGLFPEKTASMYLVEPSMPELDGIIPHRHGPRRRYVRFIMHELLASSLGYIRLTQRLRNWKGPESLVEQRAEAVLARRPHYWALVQEWYVSPASSRQTLEAPVPSTLPIEVVFPKQGSEDETTKALAELYAGFVARTSRGTLVELEHVDHSSLITPGPVFDRIVARIKQFSQASAP